MNYPSTALTILEALYQHGTDTGLEIEMFQPDVAIGRASSGWMPVSQCINICGSSSKRTFLPVMEYKFSDT